MIIINTTDQLKKFIQSTQTIYQNIKYWTGRALGKNDPVASLSYRLNAYFSDLAKSGMVKIRVENIQFNHLAKHYLKHNYSDK